MFELYKHEVKMYIKTLIIWVLCAGGMGMVCILLFSSVKDSMSGMAESFASMGAFSDAFGMTQLSIATLQGFYATEVGMVHSLGGAMFAAIISCVMLSKEEDAHTSEFLFSLPVSRNKVITSKLGAVITHIVIYNLVCVIVYVMGIVILGEEMPIKEYCIFHIMQLVMHIEIGVICFGISAFMKRNRMGIGLGIVLFLYAYDLMARVIPDLSDFKVISPFSYANAADIFSTGEVDMTALMIGIIVMVVSAITAYRVYSKRDLAT
ncbi:MAG: ABC transporter permease subunit [Lachnospira sp.]|nr:ABC transporter permease subunit [Lachnospira sp.]